MWRAELAVEGFKDWDQTLGSAKSNYNQISIRLSCLPLPDPKVTRIRKESAKIRPSFLSLAFLDNSRLGSAIPVNVKPNQAGSAGSDDAALDQMDLDNSD